MTDRQSSPPHGSLTFAAACLTVSLAPVAFGVVWGEPEAHRVEPTTIVHEIGSNYIAPLPPGRFAPLLSTDGDTLEDAFRSTLALFEDGRELGPRHTQHAWIREQGRGSFSHWGSALYFSSSDNSDPRTNGRRYTVRIIARLPFIAGWAWAACFVAAALLAVRATAQRGHIPPRATAWRWSYLLAALALYGAVRWAMSGRGQPAGVALLLAMAACLLASLGLTWRAGRELASSGLPAIGGARRRLSRWSEAIGRPLDRQGATGTVLRVAALAVPYAAFAAVLVIPWPALMLGASYYLITPVVLPLGVLLYGCQARRDHLGLVASLAITMALFALPLAALWQDAAVHYPAIGGLLPWSDASAYYYEARRLHEGYLFGWSARRPLFPGLLATLLASSGGNLQFSLAVLTALNGTAVFVLAREVRRWRGPLAATLVTAVCFLFYRVEGGAGTTLTENLGFAMGAIAFAVILKGARVARLWPVALGLAFLTIALIARAGAFFVLPAIVLAGTWIFRRDRHWLRVVTALTAAVACAAALSLAIGRLVNDSNSSQTAMSNFSYTLYGLAVGGKGWAQVQVDHPGATEGAEIYALALEEIRRHPRGLVEGAVRMWRAYLWPNEPFHAFAFLRDATHPRAWQLAAMTFALVGLAVMLRPRRAHTDVLLVAAAVGHLASIPFVPPIDAGLRVYAATMPAIAVLVAVGAGAVLRLATGLLTRLLGTTATAGPAPVEPDRWPLVAEALGLSLTATLFVGPLLVLATSRPAVVTAVACPDGSDAMHVRVSRGAFLRIEKTGDASDAHVAAVEVDERRLALTASVVELRNDAHRFTAGHTMLNVYDLESGRFVWLIAPTRLLSGTPGIFPVCGRPSDDQLSRNYGVFFANYVGPAEHASAAGEKDDRKQ